MNGLGGMSLVMAVALSVGACVGAARKGPSGSTATYELRARDHESLVRRREGWRQAGRRANKPARWPGLVSSTGWGGSGGLRRQPQDLGPVARRDLGVEVRHGGSRATLGKPDPVDDRLEGLPVFEVERGDGFGGGTVRHGLSLASQAARRILRTS
ncbi:hypothetical protein SI859A1_01253 [Aurantimonas manganoxydans SI85-9A1]|uniref:Lipoprotein n=1 Tax=Aurantimonas manganoxydans (strain ATCC BAA-1229 / DSM 21871 / SI85-9A1) TaxID=287752 RepID=Q1YJ67_AURMS|nr:hypothetical protein SI859A1_01253 [Aurantimonas manganoxydans SI85-9A1]